MPRGIFVACVEQILVDFDLITESQLTFGIEQPDGAADGSQCVDNAFQNRWEVLLRGMIRSRQLRNLIDERSDLLLVCSTVSCEGDILTF